MWNGEVSGWKRGFNKRGSGQVKTLKRRNKTDDSPTFSPAPACEKSTSSWPGCACALPALLQETLRHRFHPTHTYKRQHFYPAISFTLLFPKFTCLADGQLLARRRLPTLGDMNSYLARFPDAESVVTFTPIFLTS